MLHTEAPSSAVAVFAHPDDTESACGGTLARWAANGTDIAVVICCSGDKGSSDAKAKPAALAKRRAKEAAAAMAKLGLEPPVNLGHPDGTIDSDRREEIRGAVVELIRRMSAAVVVCPDPTAVLFGQHYVNHRDHREVGWAVLDAAAHEAGLPHYWPDRGPSHQASELWLAGTLEPDTWVDISDTLETKARALMCHESQLDEPGEWLRRMVERRAESDGKAAGVRYAEGFRRLLLG
ncbi:MAG TPA: PIG-L deacetylase family protein [Acidimicrobiales bacterium]|nr:PIG-L deacetylase family protein [Acidimicrobiales bacterium]